MRTLTITAVSAAILIAFLPSFAIADDGNDRASKRFERIDANKDGKITLEETLARTNERFDRADTDGDGELSLEEMVVRLEKRRLERRARRMMKRMDFNGDGKVTKDELENRARKRFALMDGNDDGSIEKSEIRRGGWGRKRGKRRHRRGRHNDL